MTDGQDFAQICINGHVITQALLTYPQRAKNFCDICGARTVQECPKCHKQIRGVYHNRNGGTVRTNPSTPNAPPSFCLECGHPFPWTEQRLNAAKRLARENAGFTPEETEQFVKSLESIVGRTPDSPLATSRMNKLLTKGGKAVSDGLRDIFVDVMSEAVKKTIWPS
jgi:hypothetical protein